MSREEVLAMLDAPVGQSDLEIEGAVDGVPVPAVHLSETALDLDGWSLRRGAEVFDGSERIREQFASLIPEDHPEPDRASSDIMPQAKLATADFHSAAFDPEPQLAKACKNERIHQYMTSLLETAEFKALHAETQLDETASEIAAASFAEQWVALVKTEQPDDKFKQEMQCLGAAAKALGGAAKDVGDLRDAQSAFGIGGNGGGKNHLPPAELAQMFKRVQGSRDLKRICELAGRYRRFAQAQQRKKVLHGRDDVVGVVLDGDVGRLLPHELAALDDPDLELDTMRRIVERQAMCRDYRGIEGQARGPIVVVVDESGSMSGEKIYTAKAMALALAWVARQQKRWCCLVGFSGGTDGTFCLNLPNGQSRYLDQSDEKPVWKEGPDGLMEWLEHFFSGGTDLDVPLDVLPKQWDGLGCPKGKTDIICITDAIVHVPDALRESFLAWKAREQVKMITLVLNGKPGEIGQVSDRVHCVRSLSLEEDAVAEALSV